MFVTTIKRVFNLKNKVKTSVINYISFNGVLIIQEAAKFFEPFITFIIDLICFEEVKEKSSLYGLNILGYTCATRVKTMRC